MTKILITGGAGFIGAHLTNKLSKNKKNILMVVDLLRSKGGISYLNPKCKFLKGDITNINILNKIEKWKPDIIHKTYFNSYEYKYKKFFISSLVVISCD